MVWVPKVLNRIIDFEYLFFVIRLAVVPAFIFYGKIGFL
ncbi:hypothetical protein LEP1GSC008_2722 [Leptospira kirschneri serovar Bulgarica str. Nikolaevo]|uniref:Uncharacterized protein n=1 Tax=Leptospira kirschneri serovar Bulgarica str. Nikolaevo TaxID=1240687 RepID=M6FMD8_9LEPT|nr:hypothetical protein LEP1GSC008_2722 [Leptospira kirschneri serovar Bulgarica str. Nikolaevo]